jgi:S-adenosylmethionine:diacylglycerol 3-amino-3-carboxypropyl transferase
MAEESRESWCDGDEFKLTDEEAHMSDSMFAEMYSKIKKTAEEVSLRVVHGAIQTDISPRVQKQVQRVFMFTMQEVGAQAEKVATLEAKNASLVAEMRALQEQTRILQEQNRQLADQMMHFMRQFEEARAR